MRVSRVRRVLRSGQRRHEAAARGTRGQQGRPVECLGQVVQRQNDCSAGLLGIGAAAAGKNPKLPKPRGRIDRSLDSPSIGFW